ncbi:LUD domain-containing protein [Weeksellaceae bacterium TAE3-ERU29]|nr:LUD domain-containing protein [Weeksellaceae bacterium TAE3-ERU29]
MDMSNFWGKIKNLFQSNVSEEDTYDEIDISYPEEIPLDEKFANLFIKAGGHFLYCETISIAAEYVKNIVLSEKISRMICFDPKLQRILNTLGVNYIEYPSASADCSFVGCESLVAYNGSIVLSSHQRGGRGINELPNTFIVFSNPSQIEVNLKDAMTTINKNKSGHLPNGITSIGGVDANQLDGENTQKPIIYLLLVEDE